MPAVTSSIAISELITTANLVDAIALYREAFALQPADPSLSPRLLAALSRNGGTTLCAHLGSQLVGFSYGFPGLAIDETTRDTEIYHYMELLVVGAGHRNTGIGRALMHRLRDIIRHRGLHIIRWAFDPLRPDNAHFYLDVLGSVGAVYTPNLYGIEDTGRDRGHRTDRIIACWQLTGQPRVWPGPPDGLLVGVPQRDPLAGLDTVLLALPPTLDYRDSGQLGQRICTALHDLMADGYRAISCRKTADGLAAYRLVRDSSVRPEQSATLVRMSAPGRILN